MIDITKSKVVHQWKYDRPLIACRIAPNGQQVVASSEDNKLVLWKIPSGERTVMDGHESWVHALAFSKDGTQLVSGGCDGKLIWWNALDSTPAIVRKIDAHTGWIRAVSASPDGNLLATVGNDKSIRFWDMTTGEKKGEIEAAHERHIYSVIFHPTQPFLITGDLLGKIHVWALESKTRVRTIEGTPLYTENKGQNAEFGGIRTMAIHVARNELIAGGTHKATNPFGAVHEPLMLRFGWEDGAIKKSHACEGIAGGLLWRVQWLEDGTAVAVSGGSTGGILLFFQDAQEKEVHRFMLPSLARDMDLHAPTEMIATAHYDSHLRMVSLSAG